jgi:hypothetical protein
MSLDEILGESRTSYPYTLDEWLVHGETTVNPDLYGSDKPIGQEGERLSPMNLDDSYDLNGHDLMIVPQSKVTRHAGGAALSGTVEVTTE